MRGPGDAEPRASVVVPTSGRFDELHKLLASLSAQTLPLEVLVMDDGEEPEVAAHLARDFPTVRYFHIASKRGPAFQRNRGVELATQQIVLSVDDDVQLPSPCTAEQTLADFDHSRVAAVGIPYINVRQDQVVRQGASPESGVAVIHAFVGAAHAVRRDAFLAVGGFREHFFYMGEEGDLCLRFLARGWVTRAGRAEPVLHLESPKRNLERAGYYGRRNDILFAWHNVPQPFLALHLLGTTLKGIEAAIRIGPLGPMLRGLASGFRETSRRRKERQPVSAGVYRLQRQLKLGGPRALPEVLTALPKGTGE